jgi:hypothetical protein
MVIGGVIQKNERISVMGMKPKDHTKDLIDYWRWKRSMYRIKKIMRLLKRI